MTQEFSQKEEDTFRAELFRRLGSQDLLLGEIKTQTTKTNGRVNKLENWKGFITGGLAILTAILLPLLFITINYLIK